VQGAQLADDLVERLDLPCEVGLPERLFDGGQLDHHAVAAGRRRAIIAAALAAPRTSIPTALAIAITPTARTTARTLRKLCVHNPCPLVNERGST
jgi:hypothetical protein